jgi:hypothetical protein
MAARKPIDESELPEGLRRRRTSAIPAPQSWAELCKNKPAPSQRGSEDPRRGITQDQRGQVQPKDKDTARRS